MLKRLDKGLSETLRPEMTPALGVDQLRIDVYLLVLLNTSLVLGARRQARQLWMMCAFRVRM